MINISKPYIIGETAFHHEGEKDFLYELIDVASNLGLDAIKFHSILDLDDYFVKNHDGYEVIEKIILSKELLLDVIEYANKKNLDVVLLCNDRKSLEWANENHHLIKMIEIHATGINDVFLLDRASKFPKTVIIGTGGGTLDEINFAVKYLNSQGKKDILLMHGFQNYPTNYEDICLERIERLKNLFNLPVGYADHTDPLDENNEWLSVLGLTKGALVIEKHFTTKFGEKRIDAQSAVSIEQMKKIVELSNVVYKSLSLNNPFNYSDAELKYGETGPMKKALVANTFIKKGETITEDKVAFKRTMKSSNIAQKDFINMIGFVAKEDIQLDEIIDYNKVSYAETVVDTSQFKNTNK